MTLPFPATATKRPLVEQILQQILQQIEGARYALNEKLPSEPQLMAEFGVGRSTIRESIRILAYNGILEVRQGDGTYLRHMQSSSLTLDHRLRHAKILEVHEVRRALEREAAVLAAERHTTGDMEIIRGHLQDRQTLQAAGSIPRMAESDIAFHAAIVAASKNSVLIDMYTRLRAAMTDVLITFLVEYGTTQRGDQLHADLADAIEDRQGERAAEITVELITRICTTIAVAPRK